MRMISTYEEFCELYDRGDVKPDVKSRLGRASVDHLRQKGWTIRERRAAKDLLEICRQSADHFEVAYRDAGIDFWTDAPMSR